MNVNRNQQNNENQKEEEPFGLGCALEYFSEHEEIFKMIDNLKNLVAADRSVVEKAYETFSFILSQYIEQPHLVDSHIDDLLQKFIVIVRSNDENMELKHLAFKYMFVVVNVRGYKVIVRHLPHEVADFEPVLQLLESQDPNDPETWTTRYILLLWLSIIVMIPFHMSRFDGFDEKETEKKTVMTRILDVIKIYAVVPDKCRDAAAYLSHKFITRYDVKEKHLTSFLDWAMELSLSKDSNVFVKYGTLACIATILKHGKREDLLPHARRLLEWIINAEFKNNVGSNIQKLVYKIVQRIGLTFLPPRVAAWRYKRGNRSLAANLSAGDGSIPKTSNNDEVEENEDDDIDVPDEVEEVIDQLIQGLRSIDSIVRWTAAKGVGRVTGRLPKDLADEVVGSTLELFSPRESDGAWHGGCLALAELGRRGLLLPERLPQVVPVVLKALVYDEPRGYSSVGSHIRDAACYVCWSFARAYETHILAPHVEDIASTLLVVTCFDKEINCRRAASAAFQENVGRQGSFPHGIDILTAADFFTVSVRNNAYLNVSVYIAQFEEYTLPLIDHLLLRKVDHWDSGIRELSSKALHNLTPKAPEYMIKTVLPALFEKTRSIDLNSRHGATLAIGEVIHALSKFAKEQNTDIKLILKEDLLEKTRNLIPHFRERLYFRGLGGELMKQACSDFIEKCSLSSLPFHNEDIVVDWLKLLNECLSYEVVNIRTAAISALPVLFSEFYCAPDKAQKHKEIINQYVSEVLSTTSQIARMGHALALGVLPKFMLQPNLEFVIVSLIESTLITPVSQKWAEGRRDSVKALTSISTTMSVEIGKDFTKKHILEIYHTFLEGLKDYTQDKRGDIGAWMREASVTGLQTLMLLLTERLPEVLTEDLIVKILCGIAQQAVEKIDRTRALSGRVFYSFIYNNPRVPNIPYYNEITLIFPKEECDILNWNSASATFPKFVQLIRLPPYTYSVMLGMICSVGALTETLVKNSSHSLFSYLKEEMKSGGVTEIERMCDVIYKIFVDHQKNDRITVPMFRFLDKLFDSGCLSLVIEDVNSTFIKKILKLIQMEIAGCKDIYKLIDGINVLCQFIQIKGEVCDIALVQLSILLCHRQSYVRRSTSTKLYESLLVNGDSSNIDPEKLDDVMQVLSNTNWEEPVEEVKPIRNELCGLMGIRVPVPAKKKT
ncbi:tubulin-specific chaperone D [Anoplophora glabripennis]|nr:tubulin-specific chaperone D [Anoplophora glabripennis]